MPKDHPRDDDRQAVRGCNGVPVANRLIRALRRQGPIGFVRLCLLNLRVLLSGRADRYRYVHDDAWDKAYGVDTAGTVEIDEVTAPDHEKIGAVRYEPTPPECFSFLVEAAGLQPDQAYTFIDIGSGKGRVLLMAALAGFRRVVGIELGEELHQIASRNIAAVKSAHQIGQVESIRADATRFAFPAGPVVCFLNNPFGPDILDRLLDNIERSLAAEPRPFTMIYYHSNHAERLHRRPIWREVTNGIWRDESHHYSIFEWSGAPPAG